jgi:hypothetical protein
MDNKIARGLRLGLSLSHARRLARLSTPEAIQDYVTRLPTNFEPDGDTCWSVAEVLRQGRAHCIEGAFVAACALWLNGEPPLLLDFQADGDDDHVATLFRRGSSWGAISKSNHIWLRWRDPVYRSLRELVMSYFHEYVFHKHKTLRRYSVPLDLRRFEPRLWVANGADCWEICDALDRIRHFDIVTPAQAKRLRARDAMELRAGKMVEFAAPDAKTARRY